MAKSLEGKVAVVTGGASGIGHAVVRRFLEEGAKVCVLDRNGARLKKMSVDLPGENVAAVEGDVTTLEANRRAVQAAVNSFGRLDVFVGNAGVFDGFVTLQRLPEKTIGPAFDEIFHVNVKGYLLGAKAALPELLKTSGNMIFTASAAGSYPNGGGPLYTASKHAVVGLIRQLAYELAPSIRVNGVAPGGTITDLAIVTTLKPHVAAQPDVDSKEALIRSRNPLRIAMQPEDHAAAYVLLASELGKAMTGEIIHSDGGLGVRGSSQPREPKS
jgi:NAD(P)-dependent dehydrogenase (short-subunit alcohol dehydrogenase family)